MSDRFTLVVSDCYQGAERLNFRRMERLDTITVSPRTMQQLVGAENVELVLVQTWKHNQRGYSRFYRVTVAPIDREEVLQAIDETHRPRGLNGGRARTQDEIRLEKLGAFKD